MAFTNPNRIPFEILKELLVCDLESGRLFWRAQTKNFKPAGTEAGIGFKNNGKNSYRYVRVNEIDYTVQRIIWMFANNGEEPDISIKFRDGNSANCGISNLYAAERSSFESSTHRQDRIRQKRLASVRLKKYGLTVEQYNKILVEQKGVCAICEEPETVVIAGVLTGLSVDHCHETGVVRGLLCSSCNRALAAFGDGNNEELLLSAVRYVRKSKGIQNVVSLIKCEEA